MAKEQHLRILYFFGKLKFFDANFRLNDYDTGYFNLGNFDWNTSLTPKKVSTNWKQTAQRYSSGELSKKNIVKIYE